MLTFLEMGRQSPACDYSYSVETLSNQWWDGYVVM